MLFCGFSQNNELINFWTYCFMFGLHLIHNMEFLLSAGSLNHRSAHACLITLWDRTRAGAAMKTGRKDWRSEKARMNTDFSALMRACFMVRPEGFSARSDVRRNAFCVVDYDYWHAVPAPWIYSAISFMMFLPLVKGFVSSATLKFSFPSFFSNPAFQQ